MNSVKLVIVYYSSTGTTYQMALAAKEAAEAGGAEVRLRKVRELAPAAAIDSNPRWRAHFEATQDIPEATLDDLVWVDAYLFGSPTRFGNMAAQLKQFVDTTGPIWAKGLLSNKPVAAFTSALNDHGGQESTLLALYNIFYHWGSLIVSPGYTDPRFVTAGGNPYGVSATTPQGQNLVPESVLEAMRSMVERLLMVATWIAKGKD